MTVKVLHVVDSRQLRGAEMFASDLIRALGGADVSQRVAVVHDGGTVGVQYAAPSHVLGSNGWRVPGVGIRLRALNALRTLIGTWRPDIVQAHGGDSLKYTIPASMGRDTPIVYRKIGATPQDVFGAVKRAGHGRLMRRATRIVAVAEAVRREVVESFRIPSGRVITIPNAVDPRRMNPTRGRDATRRALGIPLTSPVILSLGALTWEKDPVAHVEIGARVLSRRPEAIHVIVGDGPLRTEVEAAIQERRLNGRIQLLPARADVPDLLAMSDVLLLASRTEGMPGCVIEAGMMGLPVAAYAIAGLPDVVVDGVTGFLIAAGDIHGMAAHIVELFEDPKVSRAMGEAARERCLSLFRIDAVAPQYLELYERLIGS